MKGVHGGGARSRRRLWTVEPSNEKKDIQGRSCKRYDVLANGVKQSEIWATSLEGSRRSQGILRRPADFASFMR